jgi:hypothetical protein
VEGENELMAMKAELIKLTNGPAYGQTREKVSN